MKKQNIIKMSATIIFFLLLSTTISSSIPSLLEQDILGAIEKKYYENIVDVTQKDFEVEEKNLDEIVLIENDYTMITEHSHLHITELLSFDAVNHQQRLFKDKVICSPKNTENLVAVYVDEDIYNALPNKIFRFKNDLENDGFNVEVHVGVYGIAEDLKQNIKQIYDQPGNDLKGVILIGNIVAAWYKHYNNLNEIDAFPMDLFYMDLNGEWEFSIADGMYVGHTGDVAPEIWVGRIDATTLSGDTIALYDNYFDKNHAYRTGDLKLPNRALVYAEIQGLYHFTDLIYPYTTYIEDKKGTNAIDYMNRLKWGYEWVEIRAHSNPITHTFDSSYEYSSSVNSTQIQNLDPHVLFYQLYACGSARFTSNNYLAGSYLFADTYGILVIGSTKSGGMFARHKFYLSLSEGKDVGESFKDWFCWIAEDGFSNSKISWYYGMGVFGDPTLKPNIPNTIPVSHINNIDDYSIQSGIIELSGTVKRGLAAGSSFNSFLIDWGHGINPTEWTTQGAINYGDGILEYENDFFGYVDTSSMIENDFHTIRVTVTDVNGQTSMYRKVIRINNLEFNYPLEGDYIRGGYNVISINGSVQSTALFKNYIIEYGFGKNPIYWSTQGISLTMNGIYPLNNCELATWDTSFLSQNGYYSLRLSRIDNDGSITSETIVVVIDSDYRQGWPQKINSSISDQGVVVADVNGNGYKEIFVAKNPVFLGYIRAPDGIYHPILQYSGVYAWDSNGYPLQGWPKTQKHWTKSVSPVIGDINGDGDMEIICAFKGDHSIQGIYVWKYDGTLLPGWPKIINQNFNPRLLSVADINNDNSLEIILIADNKLYVYDKNAELLSGFPVSVATSASLAVGDINNDGYKEIVIGEVAFPYSRVSIYRYNGSLLQGWPRLLDIGGCSAVSLADFDNDGFLEIIVGTNQKLYVIKQDGSDLTGWPQNHITDVFSSIAIADINRDGNLEIIVNGKSPSDISQLTVFYHTGQIAPGWPIELSGSERYSPVIADIDGDFNLEILLAYESDKLGAWHYDGSMVSNWPKIIPLEENARTSAIIADVDNNFFGNVILGSSDHVLIWNLDSLSTPYTVEWGSYRHNPQSTALYIRPKFNVYVNDAFNPSTPGWGITHFNTIMEGIDAVEENGIVYVFEGLYIENVVISKSLSLIGINKEKTTIFALNENQAVISVYANDVVIKGFTIKDSASAGIYVSGAFFCSIKDNVIDETNDGIYFIYSNDNRIAGNEIRYCQNNAIFLRRSDDNEFYDNVLFHNMYGFGLEESSANSLASNTVFSNEYGIRLMCSLDNDINCNMVEKNSYGIYLNESADHNRIINNIFDNTINVIDQGFNFWNSDVPILSTNIVGGPFIAGNHWSDYTGYDTNYDGLGDTPYVISKKSQDNYPLLYTWSIQLVFVDDEYTSSTLGWGYNHFNEIKQGVSVVEEYGTIFVFSGFYNEQIEVSKPVTIIGENKHLTVINGYGQTASPALNINSDNVVVEGFTITGLTAVFLRKVRGCMLKDIIIKESNVGIQIMLASNNNVFSQNLITGNMQGINIDASSNNNLFYHNDFIDNEMQAFDRSVNMWYCDQIQQGNYWSDYTGVDEDSNGIGDTPHAIPGGENEDMFPLMDPFNSRQTLVFNEGWNLISFNVVPSNLSLSRIMKPLIDQGILEVMKDGGMGVLWPSFGIDTIGELDVTKGFKVKVTQDSAFELRGLPVQLPVSVELQEGWNLIGYPVSEAVDAMSIIQPLIDDEVLVQVVDSSDEIIYFNGDEWINNIGLFQSGSAYYIKVTMDTILLFNETC